MSQLKLGVLLSYATSLVSLFLGLFYTPWMISIIGQSNYGLYTLAISVINLFLLDMGLSTALTRFLSKCYSEGDIKRANTYLRTAFAVYSALALVIALVLVLVYFFIEKIYTGLSESELGTFKSLYVIVALYSVISMPFMSQQSILIANERFVAFRACGLIQKLFVALLTILCLIAGQGVYAIVAATAAGNLSFILIRMVLIYRLTDARYSLGVPSSGDAKELLGFSGWVAVSEMSGRLTWALTPSILGVFSNAVSISLFGLASQLESYVYSFADAISALLMPKMTRTIANDRDGSGLTETMTAIGRFQLVAAGLIILGFAVCGQAFVQIWLSGQYGELWLCTMFVICPHLLLLPQASGSVAITASGNVRAKSFINAGAVAFGFLLSCPLAPLYGALGACAAISLSFLVNHCLIAVLLKRRLSLHVRRYYWEVYSKWIIPAALSVLIGAVACRLLNPTGWLALIACCVFFGAVYALTMYVFYLSDVERARLKSLLRRK